MDVIKKSKAEWEEKLDSQSYQVLREKGTEQAFTGKYYNYNGKGMFVCKGCGLDLFSSESKFDSGTGWPSFSEVVESKNVKLVRDESHAMVRVEVKCARCSGHLGHVFEDGPTEKGGKRYCINSCSLELRE
jgi:peptide-methionine (R)-S-oxide reductase